MILWLVGVILLGIDLPSASECKSADCEATLAVVVIAAVEWYVSPFHAFGSVRSSCTLYREPYRLNIKLT